MAMPASVPAGCNDDFLHHCVPGVIYINHLLALPLNLKFDVGLIRKSPFGIEKNLAQKITRAVFLKN
jgi:hypothetical protein